MICCERDTCEPSSLGLTLAHSGSLRLNLAFFVQIWLSLAHPGSLWLSLAHSGSLLLSLAHSGSISGSLCLCHSDSLWLYLWHILSVPLWLTLTQSSSLLLFPAHGGSLWLSQILIGSQGPCSARYVVAAKPQFIKPRYYVIWKIYSSHISHSMKSRDYGDENQTNWNDHCNVGIHDLSFLSKLTIDGNPCHFLHPGANWVLCLMIKKTLTELNILWVTHKMRHTSTINFTLQIREIIRGWIKTGTGYQGSRVTLRVSQVFKGACMGARGLRGM